MTAAQIELDIDTVINRFVQREALDRYYIELMKQNESVNLVSRETSRADFDRLCAESLLPLEALPSRISNYLDIGSGGGFPAIPIILSGRTEGKSLLVERTLKKASALGRICGALGITCQVVPRTFEELSPRDRFDLITLRYTKLDRALLKRVATLLSRDGQFVYYSSYDQAANEFTMQPYTFTDPVTTAQKHFTVFRTK